MTRDWIYVPVIVQVPLTLLVHVRLIKQYCPLRQASAANRAWEGRLKGLSASLTTVLLSRFAPKAMAR